MKPIPLWVLAITCLFCAARLPAHTVLQFTPDDFLATEETAVWTSKKDNVNLTSVHAATNGWSLAGRENRRIVFGGNTTSPLAFSDSTSNTISYVFAVVACSEPDTYATLIDAPCSIRFIPDSFNDEDVFFYESQLSNSVALSINAVQTHRFTASTTLQLIEAAFDSPVPLNELYIGGTPATPAWKQSWEGDLAELILLNESQTEVQLNALRRYLALKHGVAVSSKSDAAIVTTLNDLGIDSGGYFNAVLLVR